MAEERAREAAGAPLVRLRALRKSYGATEAVQALDLDIAEGEFLAILGPSGCGKSTLLRMLAGFIAPSGGRIEIDGKDVSALGPERRPTNMVFQSYGLFPHMTVAENVGFGLSIAKRPQAEIASRVAAALALVRLDGMAARGVDKLSGGQQQRVALARAIIMRPRVLLLDEPLAALDLKLRQAMQEELRRIHREIGGTFIFVTHDQGEAFNLASRIVVMNAGCIEQVGRPDEVYLNPASLFVAGFVGEMNILRGRRSGDRVQLGAGPVLAAPGPDGPVSVIVRPEAFRILKGAAAADGPVIEATVREVVFAGTMMKYLLTLASGGEIQIYDGDVEAARRLEPGVVVRLAWDPAKQRILEDH
jgi:ABC-type Fe3+/spermidine/putrescine transport system ATPase subunit